MLRLFIAAHLPANQLEMLKPMLERIRQTHVGGIRWSKPENIHLTLKFLGATEDRLLEPITQKMKLIAAEFSPIHAGLGAVGAFRNHRVPRVLWVGIDRGREQLQAIAKRLDEELATLNLPVEEREFSPHLTLARFKRDPSKRETDEYVKLATTLQAPSGVEFTIDQLHLIESNPGPNGSSYKTRFSAKLEMNPS